jgi:alpha-D-xyloside xylohydrolase
MEDLTFMTYRPPLLPYVDFPAASPDLPVRQAGDTVGPEYVMQATVAATKEQDLSLIGTTNRGQSINITLSIAAPGIVRVLLHVENADCNRVALARDLSDQAVSVLLLETDNCVTLLSDLVRVEVRLNPFQLIYLGLERQVTLSQNYTDADSSDNLLVLPFGFSSVEGRRVAFHDTFTAEPDEHFYGFGEKFTDFDKRGQRLEMWNYDATGAHSERTYKNVPFFLSSRGYGIFVDSITHINFDMAYSNLSTFSLIVPDRVLDYYVIMGPEPKSIISRYGSLVGLPILPPKWAFGLWISSGFQADSGAEVVERAHELRTHDLPCDVLHLDCFWQRHGRWSEMLWDREAFPDPEGLLRQLKEMGFKICLWMNSYLGVESERFLEAKQKGYLLKTPQGEVYVGQLWSGYHPPVGILDFTNPEASAWFKELLRPLFRQGVDVLKTDFGEAIPADVVAFNGMTGEQLHNLYSLLYNDLVAEVTAEETGRAGLVWGRSTYAGGQRHAAQWSGDPNCTYQAMASTLRGGLSLGMCGHPFWSHDLGGFHREPTPNLYIRWSQFGLLSPLSRAHGQSTRLPWDFGEDALRIFRDYLRLRYRLLPYIYSYAVLAVETGLPIMRPMILEFPDDPNTYTLDLQYMFGSDLLIAPIYNSMGKRSVYFPAGRWVDFWTLEVIEGPQARWIEAPLEVLPLYVRANTLLPTIVPPVSLTDAPFEMVTFDGYLFDHGSCELRDTDGRTQIQARFNSSQLDIQIDGIKKRLGLRLLPLPGAPTVNEVQVNGKIFDRVDNLEIDPNANPDWTRDQDGTVRVMVQR